MIGQYAILNKVGLGAAMATRSPRLYQAPPMDRNVAVKNTLPRASWRKTGVHPAASRQRGARLIARLEHGHIRPFGTDSGRERWCTPSHALSARPEPLRREESTARQLPAGGMDRLFTQSRANGPTRYAQGVIPRATEAAPNA